MPTTKLISIDNISEAASLLKDGKLLAYPTESVFGLGCSPECKHSVERLFLLKNRSRSKKFILVASKFLQIERYIDLSRLQKRNIQEVLDSWPGPYTWIFPASKSVPKWLLGEKKDIALRISAHPPVVSLCDAFGGAIVSTSANPQGLTPAKTTTEAISYFNGEVDAVLNACIGTLERPTVIRDSISGELIRI